MIADEDRAAHAPKTHRPSIQSYTTRSSRTKDTSAERAKASRSAVSQSQRYQETEKSPLKRQASSSAQSTFSFAPITPQAFPSKAVAVPVLLY